MLPSADHVGASPLIYMASVTYYVSYKARACMRSSLWEAERSS